MVEFNIKNIQYLVFLLKKKVSKKIYLNKTLLRLVVPQSKEEIFCHPKVNPEDESYGWCKTMGNHYDIDKEKPEQPGWGFCGKDCFSEQVPGVLSQKKIILWLDISRMLKMAVCSGPKRMCTSCLKSFVISSWLSHWRKQENQK